jgi:polyisoprenyl-phosphate glycosyltransferase
MRSQTAVAIVCPVLDDWDSFYKLAHDLDRAVAGSPFALKIFAVDDGSTTGPNTLLWESSSFNSVITVEVIHLATNLGHQRAITVGLVAASRIPEIEAVIVMDCDGEDRPQDLLQLLNCHKQGKDDLVVVSRGKRTEGPMFRIGYACYKLMFWLLAGRSIGFGNFCLIPKTRLSYIIYRSDVWNHLAATISRCRLPVRTIRCLRGTRYFGSSRMNLSSLVIFGLSAISVYIDVVVSRILAVTATFIVMCLVAIAIIISIKEFTDVAIPGWATNALGFAIVALLQNLSLSIAAILFALYSRSIQGVIPAKNAYDYVLGQSPLYTKSDALMVLA